MADVAMAMGTPPGARVPRRKAKVLHLDAAVVRVEDLKQTPQQLTRQMMT